MKNIVNGVAALVAFGGLMMMAGSAGDCDGQCGPGNTIGEMLMVAGIGLTMMIAGGAILLRNASE